MVDVDTNDCLKSLQQYQAKLERELTGRTLSLMTKWIYRIEDATPKGDIVKFLSLYEQRQENEGWDIKPGLLMGNWQMFTEGEQTSGFIQRYDVSINSLTQDRQTMSFKLGDNIILSNSTPYIGKIDQLYTEKPRYGMTGIKKPILNAILDLYKIPFPV